MELIMLNRKTGFRNLRPLHPVVIRDFRGKMFYSTEGLKPVKFFNLPPGQYYIESGDFVKMRKPYRFRLPKLPMPERNLKPPYDFDIIFGYNPNKCTINWIKKTITFDTSLKNATIPVLWFMIFHEYGHSLYSTEKYADLCSSKLMLIRGFNPSQIGIAPIISLSSKQYKRKKYLTRKIKNLQR